METILATFGILLLIVLFIFYGLPLLGSWVLMIVLAVKEGIPKSDAWIMWLMGIGSVVPIINIIIFIILIKTMTE